MPTILAVPDALEETFQIGLPKEASVLSEAHDQTYRSDRTVIRRTIVDPSTSVHADRLRDIDRFIQAFTQTVAVAHPSLTAGLDPPDLAAIAARFLPSARDTPQRTSALTLLDQTPGFTILRLPSSPVPSTSLRLDGTFATRATTREPEAPDSRGNTFGRQEGAPFDFPEPHHPTPSPSIVMRPSAQPRCAPGRCVGCLTLTGHDGPTLSPRTGWPHTRACPAKDLRLDTRLHGTGDGPDAVNFTDSSDTDDTPTNARARLSKIERRFSQADLRHLHTARASLMSLIFQRNRKEGTRTSSPAAACAWPTFLQLLEGLPTEKSRRPRFSSVPAWFPVPHRFGAVRLVPTLHVDIPSSSSSIRPASTIFPPASHSLRVKQVGCDMTRLWTRTATSIGHLQSVSLMCVGRNSQLMTNSFFFLPTVERYACCKYGRGEVLPVTRPLVMASPQRQIAT